MKAQLFFFLLLASTAYTQEDENPSVVIEMCDSGDEAGFPEGNAAMLSYISSSVRIVDCIFENTRNSRVYVQFIIEKDGSLSEISVFRAPCVAYEQMIREIFERMPCWIPAQNMKGNVVRSWIRVPITICLK